MIAIDPPYPLLRKWNGTTFEAAPAPTMQASFGSSGATHLVISKRPRRDRRLRLLRSEHRLERTNVPGSDFAPDQGFWTYMVGGPPPASAF